jgi:hypothetical protein
MQYPKSYLQYQTQYQGKSECINAALWDTVAYPQAGALQLTYFTATRATVDLSNMEVAGQLPYPKAFLVRSVKIYLKQRPESINEVGPAAVQTGAVDNIAGIINGGALQFTIGSKNYGPIPLWALTSGGGPFGMMQVANVLIAGAVADYGNIGTPHAKAAYTLSVPLFIEPQMNFRVDIVWGAVFAVTRALTFSVVLEGDLFRPVQ